MSRHYAEVAWERGQQIFTDGRYSRQYSMKFDGGSEVPASASPHIVPPPMSDASAVDPEEAFVASLAGCHMLWFLSIAADHGFCVDRYADHAIGEMTKNENGQWMIGVVTLRPDVRFSGARKPTREQISHLHEEAHRRCFIANSVLSEIRFQPVFDDLL